MVLYDGVTVAVMGELTTPRYVYFVSTCLLICLYHFYRCTVFSLTYFVVITLRRDATRVDWSL